MKRKRCEMEEATKEKKITMIGSAVEELSVLSIAKTTIVTTETEATTNIINLPLKPLLSFCRLIIQVLGIYSRIYITRCYAVFVSFFHIFLGGPGGDYINSRYVKELCSSESCSLDCVIFLDESITSSSNGCP